MPYRPLAAIGLGLALAGCAAAVPGYQPPTPKLQKYWATKQSGGGFDGGGYRLTDQEKTLNCRQLTGSVTLKIIQLRSASTREKPSAAASMAQKAVPSMIGNVAYGADIESDMRRDRARLDALNRQLAVKACATFDLEAELRPGNTERPAPIKPAAKGKGKTKA